MWSVGLIHQSDVKTLATRERDETIDGPVQPRHLVAPASRRPALTGTSACT